MISPAKTAADSRYWRSIKYSLFPPLGLATLAGYLDPDDEIDLQDEHVETLRLDDEPDLVVIEAYITSAGRAYRYADHYRATGAYVCLGGLHPTSLPEEAAQHADSVFCGPGEDTWPAFLRDFRAGRPKPLYRSTERTLAGLPPARRDLIKRERYLVPNSLVVSRGCPHICDFCYKEAFFRGGRSFYVQAVDDALAEIDRLPGRHLYFLDDNLFGSPPFAEALFDGLKGDGPRVAGGRDGGGGAASRPAGEGGGERAAQPVRRLRDAERGEPAGAGKTQNLAGAAAGGRGAASGAPLGPPQYDAAVRRLHDLGVMVNGGVRLRHGPRRRVRVPAHRGVGGEPRHRDGHVPHHDAVPGHAAGARGSRPRAASPAATGTSTTRGTRCSRPAGMTAAAARGRLPARVPRVLQLAQHRRARPSRTATRASTLRHLAYTTGWKKLEPMWDRVIRSGQVHRFLPLLETILDRFGSGGGAMPGRLRPAAGPRPASRRGAGRPGAVDLRRTAGPSASLPGRAS